jgi:hypothetical protein
LLDPVAAHSLTLMLATGYLPFAPYGAKITLRAAYRSLFIAYGLGVVPVA